MSEMTYEVLRGTLNLTLHTTSCVMISTTAVLSCQGVTISRLRYLQSAVASQLARELLGRCRQYGSTQSATDLPWHIQETVMMLFCLLLISPQNCAVNLKTTEWHGKNGPCSL